MIASGRPAVFFSNAQDTNLTCVRVESLELAEIPLHADVVKDFQNIESGNYYVTTSVKELMNDL